MDVKDLPKNPLAVTIKMIGCRWKVMIIGELLKGTKRFSEINHLSLNSVALLLIFFIILKFICINKAFYYRGRKSSSCAPICSMSERKHSFAPYSGIVINYP